MTAGNDPYGVDTDRVREAFNAAAGTYDEAAVLQAEVRSRLLERLEAVAIDPARVLDAGAGTGLAAPGLAARFPRADLVLLDVADGMLRETRNRGMTAVCSDAAALPFGSGTFGTVFSSLMLQWAPDLDRVLGEFRRVLSGGGLLIFSTFGPDTLAELRAAWASADGYTHVNRFTDMHDVGDALVRSGFAEPVLDVEHFTLTYPDLRALMSDLKAIGARNLTAGRSRGLTGRGRLAAAEREYERWRRDGRLVSTWEVIYGIAWVAERADAPEPPGSPSEIRIAADRIGRRR